MLPIELPRWIEEDAYFSGPQHRIWLRRRLAMFGRPVCFLLHNPSVAAASVDDPTSRRCVSFANALGGSDLIIVNAATGIATDADDLAAMEDPIGPMADEALLVAAELCRRRDGILIAGWGRPKGKAATQRRMAKRFDHILGLGLPLHTLRLTASGFPEHPLYLPSSLHPRRWDHAKADG